MTDTPRLPPAPQPHIYRDCSRCAPGGALPCGAYGREREPAPERQIIPAQPGGNATGFTHFEYGISAKGLELLRDVAPTMRRVTALPRVALISIFARSVSACCTSIDPTSAEDGSST